MCYLSGSSKSVRALLRRATGWFVSFKPLFPSAVGQQPKCRTDKHLKLRDLLKMQELKCVPIFEYKCEWSTARKTNIEDRDHSLKLGNIPIRFMSLPHLQQQQQHVDQFCQGLWHFPRYFFVPLELTPHNEILVEYPRICGTTFLKKSSVGSHMEKHLGFMLYIILCMSSMSSINSWVISSIILLVPFITSS